MELTAAQCNFIYETALAMLDDPSTTELSVRRFFLNYFPDGSFSDEQVDSLTEAIHKRYHNDCFNRQR